MYGSFAFNHVINSNQFSISIQIRFWFLYEFLKYAYNFIQNSKLFLIFLRIIIYFDWKTTESTIYNKVNGLPSQCQYGSWPQENSVATSGTPRQRSHCRRRWMKLEITRERGKRDSCETLKTGVCICPIVHSRWFSNKDTPGSWVLYAGNVTL